MVFIYFVLIFTFVKYIELFALSVSGFVFYHFFEKLNILKIMLSLVCFPKTVFSVFISLLELFMCVFWLLCCLKRFEQVFCDNKCICFYAVLKINVNDYRKLYRVFWSILSEFEWVWLSFDGDWWSFDRVFFWFVVLGLWDGCGFGWLLFLMCWDGGLDWGWVVSCIYY